MRPLQRFSVAFATLGCAMLLAGAPAPAQADTIPVTVSTVNCQLIVLKIETPQHGQGWLAVDLNGSEVVRHTGLYLGPPLIDRWPAAPLLIGQNGFTIRIRNTYRDYTYTGSFSCSDTEVLPSPTPLPTDTPVPTATQTQPPPPTASPSPAPTATPTTDPRLRGAAGGRAILHPTASPTVSMGQPVPRPSAAATATPMLVARNTRGPSPRRTATIGPEAPPATAGPGDATAAPRPTHPDDRPSPGDTPTPTPVSGGGGAAGATATATSHDEGHWSPTPGHAPTSGHAPTPVPGTGGASSSKPPSPPSLLRDLWERARDLARGGYGFTDRLRADLEAERAALRLVREATPGLSPMDLQILDQRINDLDALLAPALLTWPAWRRARREDPSLFPALLLALLLLLVAIMFFAGSVVRTHTWRHRSETAPPSSAQEVGTLTTPKAADGSDAAAVPLDNYISGDGREVRWGGVTHNFSLHQGGAVRYLYDNYPEAFGWKEIQPYLREQFGKDYEVGYTGIPNLFQGHPTWRDLIQKPAHGRYRFERGPAPPVAQL